MAIAATSDNCLLTTHAFVKTHLSFQGTLKYCDYLENTDSNLMISKEEIIPKLNQQVCKHKSSKVDEFQCYRYLIASYNCYQKYSLALSAVLFCRYVNS